MCLRASACMHLCVGVCAVSLPGLCSTTSIITVLSNKWVAVFSWLDIATGLKTLYTSLSYNIQIFSRNYEE